MDDASILVVDDEEAIRLSLGEALREEGYTIIEAASGEEAIALVRRERPDLMLLDMKLPKASGIDVLRQARKIQDDIVAIIMTAFADVATAVKCMRYGAYDYVNKPFSVDALKVVVRNALETLSLKKELSIVREREQQEFEADFIVGENPRMRKVCEYVKRVARSNSSTVLVQGESGTGKELIARAIHYWSFRRDKMFVDFNCTAVPEALVESELFGFEKGAFTDAKQQKKGLFELADKGTLFLDEIGDMSYKLQAKLLRALQERSFTRVGGVSKVNVDIRIIASTNRDLQAAMAAGKFREDLYYRLHVVPITLPPLRERGSDILLLAKHFIDRFNREFKKNVYKIAPETQKLMLEYHWPGNVRELKNTIERSILLECEDELLPEHLLFAEAETRPKPESEAAAAGTEMTLEEVERDYIRRVVEAVGWNKNRAAKTLGIDRTTLYTKIKKYGLARS
jgi:two-component system response regulator AtoC